MISKYPIFISEEILKNEENLASLILDSCSKELSIVEFKNQDPLLGINILNSNDISLYQGENLSFEFLGPNLNFLEKEKSEIISFESLKELKELLPSIDEYILKSTTDLFSRLISKSNSNIRKLKAFDLESCSMNLAILEQFQAQVLEAVSFDDLRALLEASSYDLELKQLYELSSLDMKKDIILISERSNVFALFELNGVDKDQLAIMSFLIENFERYDYVEQHLEKSFEEAIFFNLPYAAAVYNIDQRIVNHNLEFGKLAISTKDLVALKHEQTIHLLEGTKYRVIIEELNDKLRLVSFILIEDLDLSGDSQSSEELGIVSSSIAHELNNPLAGILAALDVLLLDDLEQGMNESFIQMKDGVSRCKELVETFLAFSRKEDGSVNSSIKTEDLLDQVVRIARYRLIESNIQMKIDYQKLAGLSCERRPHLLTMALYLILGEVLTNTSRDSLVQNKSSSSLEITVVEKERLLALKFNREVKITNDFKRANLFKHILGQLEVTLENSNQEITLSFYK